MNTTLKEIQDRIYDAMKSKNEILLTVLREMKSKINLAEKEGQVDFINVFQSMAKARKQSIEAFEKANKLDLVNKEKQELTIIEHYLPKLMTDKEINKEVCNIIRDKYLPINIKNMGNIIKDFKVKFPGQDGIFREYVRIRYPLEIQEKILLTSKNMSTKSLEVLYKILIKS